MYKDKKQKGISIYLVFMIMTIILGASLALSSLVLIRFRVVSRAGGAVTAFYAADAGAEHLLYQINNPQVNPSISTGFSAWADVDASYTVRTTCSADCSLACPVCLMNDPSCDAPRFCVTSLGVSGDTQRALRVKY